MVNIIEATNGAIGISQKKDIKRLMRIDDCPIIIDPNRIKKGVRKVDVAVAAGITKRATTNNAPTNFNDKAIISDVKVIKIILNFLTLIPSTKDISGVIVIDNNSCHLYIKNIITIIAMLQINNNSIGVIANISPKRYLVKIFVPDGNMLIIKREKAKPP